MYLLKHHRLPLKFLHKSVNAISPKNISTCLNNCKYVGVVENVWREGKL